MTSKKARSNLADALEAFDLDIDRLDLIESNALSYFYNSADRLSVHMVDRTPVIVDPDIGGGAPRESCFPYANAFDLGGYARTDAEGFSNGNSRTSFAKATAHSTVSRRVLSRLRAPIRNRSS